VEAAESGIADLQAEALRRIGGNELGGFGVGVFREPLYEALFLVRRNFLGE
jgi:hypothetical protein